MSTGWLVCYLSYWGGGGVRGGADAVAECVVDTRRGGSGDGCGGVCEGLGVCGLGDDAERLEIVGLVGGELVGGGQFLPC